MQIASFNSSGCDHCCDDRFEHFSDNRHDTPVSDKATPQSRFGPDQARAKIVD
ncbi:MAG: hypothetical protein RQ741_02680 [Wenzhouxiangellaceae bacterium]|nr:hypothetical protein [Wenzhouxiangellaceae bacterium]